MTPGSGEIKVNDRPLDRFFGRQHTGAFAPVVKHGPGVTAAL
jgi:hypothetical protein